MAQVRRRNNSLPRAMPWLVLIVVLAIGAYLYWQRRHISPPSAGVPAASQPVWLGVNMLLGNPSGASADPAKGNNYLLDKKYFVLSYNSDMGRPNWVSWKLTAADLGNAPRKQLFDTDTDLPRTLQRIAHQDYSSSGFDRGHLCPHSDRAANQAMSDATFVMTNIFAQAPNVNQKAWANLEDYCRALVRRKHRLYIIAGPHGQGGQGSAGKKELIGKGGHRVAVPSDCWKIVVDVAGGDAADELGNITAKTRVISVWMPNDNDAVGENWAQFRTSPARIEQATGLQFFTNLPDDVAAQLRQQVDRRSIQTSRSGSGD